MVILKQMHILRYFLMYRHVNEHKIEKSLLYKL